MSVDAPLTARAWCGKWFFPKAGVLALNGGRLTYSIAGQTQFDVSLAEVQNLTWHWYSFSSAFEATVHGKNYFISFLGPGNTVRTWLRGIRTGRQWREELTRRLRP